MIALLISLWVCMTPVQAPVMPACEEDAVIIGTGDFANGQWSSYVCGPSVDDYMTPERRERIEAQAVQDYLNDISVRVEVTK